MIIMKKNIKRLLLITCAIQLLLVHIALTENDIFSIGNIKANAAFGVTDVLISCQVAEASDGHGLPWGDFLLRIVNAAIFVGIIWYAAGKKLKSFFAGRREVSHIGISSITV